MADSMKGSKLIGHTVYNHENQTAQFVPSEPVTQAAPVSREEIVDIPFSDSPCGHSSQYAHTSDGGKTIICLICEVERLTLKPFAAPVSPRPEWIAIAECEESDNWGHEVRIRLRDGSELAGAILQNDGDWWWRERYFDPSEVTHVAVTLTPSSKEKI